MKINCIVQARMASERFPGKIMKNLSGKPMIAQLLNSLTFSKKIDELIVATTTNSSDDVLVEYLQKNHWKYFRGNENDVLKRYVDTVAQFPADYIVRITADNPLTDPEIVDFVIDRAISSQPDYISNHLVKTYPLGYVVEIISTKALIEIEKISKTTQEREHVTWHIIQNQDKFLVENFSAPENLIHPDWRLTVDTEEDFELIQKIYSKLSTKGNFIKYEDVVNLILEKPELLKINCNVQQKVP